MMKKKEKVILEELISSGKVSTNEFLICTGKRAAEVLKKPYSSLADAAFKCKKYVGFEARLNVDLYKLQHWLESEILLPSVWQNADLKNHPYFNKSPQLMVSFPLDSKVDDKRDFLTLANRHFSKLIKEHKINVVYKGKEFSYKKGKDLLRNKGSSLKVIDVKHEKSKGKRDPLYAKKKQELNDLIVTMVEDEYKNTGRPDYKEVARKLRNKDINISPKTVSNIYHSNKPPI